MNLKGEIGKRAGLSADVLGMLARLPEGYAGQLLYPFRRKGEATPYG